MRKPSSCICENKAADQLRSNCAADQRLCFRHIDSTIPLPFKSEILSLLLSSVAVQPCLCRTWSETRKLFSHNEAHFYTISAVNLNMLMRLHNYTSSSVCVSFAQIKSIFFIKRVDTSLYSFKKKQKKTSNNARIDRCIFKYIFVQFDQ